MVRVRERGKRIDIDVFESIRITCLYNRWRGGEKSYLYSLFYFIGSVFGVAGGVSLDPPP